MRSIVSRRVPAAFRHVVWGIGLLILFSHAQAASAALVPYQEMPDNWRTLLIDHDKEGVYDHEYALWIEQTQAWADTSTKAGMTVFGTFIQCHSGGFITAVDEANIRNFGVNSSCKYFQTAAYDPGNNRSYYSHEWFKALNLNPLKDDKEITEIAYANNPQAPYQFAQYLGNGAPPESLGTHEHLLAVLFAGNTGVKDAGDAEEAIGALSNKGVPRGDILLLFGDGAAPGGPFTFTPDGKGTKALLQKGLAGAVGGADSWLRNKIKAISDTTSADTTTVQLFLWTGDHGNADKPISFSVDPPSRGQAGTGVRDKTGPPARHQAWVYEGGRTTNTSMWRRAGPANIDAIATGHEPVPASSEWNGEPIYFSVDSTSFGLRVPESAVWREFIDTSSSPAPDVFLATFPLGGPGSNRQSIDGSELLGLLEPSPELPDTSVGLDNLNALSLGEITSVVVDTLKLKGPIFYSIEGGGTPWDPVYVWDPRTMSSYVYLDWNTVAVDSVAKPHELDAMALRDDFARTAAPDSALWFDPAVDELLFSVGRDDPFWRPCEIIKIGGGVVGMLNFAPCTSIGLRSGAAHPDSVDNVDALDVMNQSGVGGYFDSTEVVPSTVPDPQLDDQGSLRSYPNPLETDARIEFDLPNATFIELTVFDPRGRRVRTLFSGRLDAGLHALTWDGRDERGRRLGSGTYLYRLFHDGKVETNKLLLLR